MHVWVMFCFGLLLGSMSLEKFFGGGSVAFLFVFWALFMVLYGVCGFVFTFFA